MTNDASAAPTPSPDLSRLLRWEEAGATWELLGLRRGAVTIALLRCDGGEEVERMVSTAPDLLEYIAATDPCG